MANFVYNIWDSTTGQALGGCEISDQIDTTACPGWPNTGNCTSGPGWTAVANAGETTGQYTTPTVYTCPMHHTVTVSAPGYQSTTIEVETGNIDGDAAVPDGGIQLTPNANVAQGNQGVGSSTLSGSTNAADSIQGALGSFWGSLTNPVAGAEADVALVAIAVIVIVIVGVVLYLMV